MSENKNTIGQIKSVEVNQLLKSVTDNFRSHLVNEVVDSFDKIDDTMFNLAEKAFSNEKQNLYFSSIKIIRRNKQTIISDFEKKLVTVFNQFKRQDLNYFDTISESNKPDSLSLELIDENDLDESLAISNLIRKSETAYHKHLFELNIRIATLINQQSLSLSTNPIAPFVIVNAYSESLKNISLDNDIKLIMYKQFERNIMAKLNSIYTGINQYLINNNINSEIKYNYSRNDSESGIKTSQDVNEKLRSSLDNVDNYIHNNQINNRQNLNHSSPTRNSHYLDNNYQTISQIFNATRHFSNRNTSTNSNKTISFSMPIMIDRLSSYQHTLLSDTNLEDQLDKSPIAISCEILKKFNHSDENKIANKDEDIIDLMGLFFQFMVNDRNLPDKIQVILSKLQIPYLKIALQDRNLFADKSHEARLLLDKLALASVSWSEEADHKNQFINKIQETTNHILDTTIYNSKIFKILHMNFDAFLKKLNKKSDILQKRTKERTIGEEKIIRAKKDSAQTLVMKMSNHSMPSLVRKILLEEWSNVLNLLFLRDSTNSRDMSKNINFIDDLIRISHLSEHKSYSEPDVIELINTYANGLKLIAYQSHEIRIKRQALQDEINKNIAYNNNCIIKANNIFNLSEFSSNNNEIISFIDDIVHPNSSNKPQMIDDIFDVISKKLKIGTWLDFRNLTYKPIRAKLSWISPLTCKYLFVNARGLKVSSQSQLSIADGLRSKNVRVIKSIAIFDRALKSIASDLRSENGLNQFHKQKQLILNRS